MALSFADAVGAVDAAVEVVITDDDESPTSSGDRNDTKNSDRITATRLNPFTYLFDVPGSRIVILPCHP